MKQLSFLRPSEGTPNNNAHIGPFCCTGVTAVAEAKDGYAVGYAYFFTWHGQAYTDGTTGFAPDVAIMLAGLEDVHDPTSKLIEAEIDWAASEMEVGATKSAQAGDLAFTALIEHVDLVYGSSSKYTGLHWNMNTMAVRIDIALADASP